MGSSQSTRKLTVSNEEEAGVIKVSNSLIQRLANANKETPTEGVKEVRPSLQQQPVTTKVSSVPPLPQSDAAGQPVYYCTDLTLSALQLQHLKESEILELEQYWQKQLQNLEKNYATVNNIMEEEYQKALKEYQSGKKSVNIYEKKPPCEGTSAKVLKCYQAHPNEILQCSNVVEEFYNCVDQCRTNVIATHC